MQSVGNQLGIDDDDFTSEEWLVTCGSKEASRYGTHYRSQLRSEGKDQKGLESGGVIEPPVFQQRCGPFPPWMMPPGAFAGNPRNGGASEPDGGFETVAPGSSNVQVGGSSSSAGLDGCVPEEPEPVAPGSSDVQVGGSSDSAGRSTSIDLGAQLLQILSPSGGLIVCLGHHPAVWVQLFQVNEAFSSSGVLRALVLLRDTGAEAAVLGSGTFEAVFNFGASGPRGSWTLAAVGMVEGVVGDVDHRVSESSSSEDETNLPIGPSVAGLYPDSDEEAIGPNHQVGGSSASHGMTSQNPAGLGMYDDYLGPPLDLHCFPMVGSWTPVHYGIQLLSIQGPRILAFLGDRDQSWIEWRVASAFFRHGVASAVYEELRRGHQALILSQLQWQEITESYIVKGSFGVAYQGPFFPLVSWGPPHVTHYLWVLFSQQGHRLLDFLGDRVCEWFVCVRLLPASGRV